jgi:hypothetical protein
MALLHQPALRPSQPHIHLKGEQCPVCDQPVPNEKAEQVRIRLEARDRELSDSVGARLKEQFAAERVQLEANGRVQTDRLTREHAAAMEAAKAEAAQREIAAREASQQQIDNLMRTNADLQALAKTEIATIRAAAAQKEAAAREEGSQAAQVVAQQRIAALLQANAVAETAAKEKIDTLTQANADVRAAAQEQVAQALRTKAEIEAAARERVANAEIAKLAAENEAKTTKDNHAAVLNERLQEQREALEKANAAALNERNAKHFEENQKLKDKLDEAVRKLDQKTAEELGEGAHIDLLEELKECFEGDRIRRVPRGAPGADIIHEVILDGKVCGKIVYDSKNRNQWRTEHATKLCEDKIAEGADHAILSSLKFPAEKKQIEIRDGVIILNPARVTAIAELLRESIIRCHSLRLSNQEREKKQGELYGYITGDRFQQHLDTLGSQTDKLLDIEVAEEKAQRKVREARGTLLQSLRKTEGNLRADVGRIIGTHDTVE